MGKDQNFLSRYRKVFKPLETYLVGFLRGNLKSKITNKNN